MASYLLLVQANPDDITTGLQALEQAQQLASQGETIAQVFFYGQGVLYANRFLSFPSGLPNLQAAWLKFSQQHNVPLVVCATVASQYGVEALPPPAGNLAEGFHAGGLTEFMATLVSTDTLLQYPGLKPTATAPSGDTISFIYNQPPLHASARHGLDMLLMAVSLDQPAAAVFVGEGICQLAAPKTDLDPLKKMTMLPDIFDFESFYTTADTLKQAGLKPEQLRLPVTILTAAELEQLVGHDSKHVVRF
ncbi:DsrE family protein [Aliidiomarina quisquiliarum]|uniref:DsrE family protein n=1 Tax=Aliidiomarina quisquiliarum TaxID=2938947 RepID=UPI00208F808C|nr:DsrE family protein [Aliidiomarina quisquiliarum]MCO4320782.1 DsrE family protein [Aliidiomarina quisquiliarum]